MTSKRREGQIPKKLLAENAYDVIMTSLFVQFFENVSFSSSYKGLLAHKIWFNLGQRKQSYGGGGGGRNPPPRLRMY